MKLLKYVFLFCFLALGSFGSIQAQESDSPVVITLERTACFGTCPVYRVAILEDGTVIYTGDNFVEVTGEQRWEIGPETVAAMLDAIEAAGYFDWDEAYDTQTVSDLPTVITSATRDGETHQIVHYTGDYSAPLALPFLELWIDEMAMTSGWTGAQSDLASVSNGTDTPIVTLERGACFGTCPIYNVAAYEDGTVVYMGIAYVEDIGVEVSQEDPNIVSNIAEIAELYGYFGWQDRYEEYVMTDNYTVISSIWWNDQYKRIVRYGGDPNAPVGLTWIEDDISRLVADNVGE